MSTLLTPPTLEVVLQGLHESDIRCGIQNDPPAGGITAWVDFGSRTEKATFYGTIVGNRQVWPAADRIAAWMHETAMRLFPDSPYAKEHTSPVVGICKTPGCQRIVLQNVPSKDATPEGGRPPILNRPTMVNTRLSAPIGRCD
jgi:hypothetical protein